MLLLFPLAAREPALLVISPSPAQGHARSLWSAPAASCKSLATHNAQAKLSFYYGVEGHLRNISTSTCFFYNRFGLRI